jgi:hypothetical protein
MDGAESAILPAREFFNNARAVANVGNGSDTNIRKT